MIVSHVRWIEGGSATRWRVPLLHIRILRQSSDAGKVGGEPASPNITRAPMSERRHVSMAIQWQSSPQQS
jgi:hypothetical protein